MKKKLSMFLLLIIACFFSVVSVHAADTTLKVNPSKVNVSTNSKDYTFQLTFSNATGTSWKLSYDNDIYPTGTNPIANGKLSSENGTIEFAVKKNLTIAEDKTVNISIKDENSGEEVKASVIILKNVAATTTTTQKVTTTKTEAKSNNANLKSLELTDSNGETVLLTPNFSSNVYNYSATVLSTVKTVSVTAVVEDEKASVTTSSNVDDELKSGENNKITITVTAEDGTKKSYIVNVKREALSADASLKSLTIKEDKDFELVKDKYNYDVTINDNINTLTLDYETSSLNSIVKVSGNKNLKNGSKVKILITAEDGTKKEYILNIIKKTTTTKKQIKSTTEERNPLIIMGLSLVAFGLIGGIIYIAKKH